MAKEIVMAEIGAKQRSKKAVRRESSTHVPIKGVVVGDNFSGVYYLEAKYIKTASNGNKYTELVLRDKSGAGEAKFWGEVTLDVGVFVELTATVEAYRGKPSVIVQNIVKTDTPDDLSDYVSVSDTQDEDKKYFRVFVESVKEIEKSLPSQTCTAVLGEVFDNHGFFDDFSSAPGNTLPSFGMVGGLLKYTVQVAKLAERIADVFGFTDAERVVLLAGALLHGVGGPYACEIENCAPVESRNGILCGALNIGFSKIALAIKRVTHLSKKGSLDYKIDDEASHRLLHAVVSWGRTNNVPPMTREAIALRGAVYTVNELAEAGDFIANDITGGEFTAFDPARRRRYYKGA